MLDVGEVAEVLARLINGDFRFASGRTATGRPREAWFTLRQHNDQPWQPSREFIVIVKEIRYDDLQVSMEDVDRALRELRAEGLHEEPEEGGSQSCPPYRAHDQKPDAHGGQRRPRAQKDARTKGPRPRST